MTALLSWLWGLVPVDKAAIAGCAALVALLLAAGGALWWQNIHVAEQDARIASLERDMSTAISANRQANATITRMERSANATAAVTSVWTSRGEFLSSLGRDAAAAISETQNDDPQSPSCLDAALPDAIAGPLDRLRGEACAASGGGTESCGLAASGIPAQSKADTKAPGRDADVQETRAVDGRASGSPGKKRGR